MTDRTLHFFATPDESRRWLSEIAAGAGLALVTDAGSSRTLRSLAAEEPLPAGAAWAYLGFEDLSTGDPADVVGNPGQHAWVRFQLPRLEDELLQMAGLDIRTSWLTHDNPAGVTVFNRIAKRIRPSLRRPTWAWSIESGVARSYRDVAFTDGALELFESGTEWTQWGGPKTRFGPAPPSS